MKSYWAIREKATGFMFPRSEGNKTFIEFSDDLPPRLFGRRQDALASARHWVKGHSYIPWNRRNDEFCKSFDYVTKPVEGRDIDKLEIVEVMLQVI